MDRIYPPGCGKSVWTKPQGFFRTQSVRLPKYPNRSATLIKENLQPCSKSSFVFLRWNTGGQRIWKADKNKAGICHLSAKSRPFLCLKSHAEINSWKIISSACAFSVFINPTQRMGSRAFNSSVRQIIRKAQDSNLCVSRYRHKTVKWILSALPFFLKL